MSNALAAAQHKAFRPPASVYPSCGSEAVGLDERMEISEELGKEEMAMNVKEQAILSHTAGGAGFTSRAVRRYWHSSSLSSNVFGEARIGTGSVV